MDQPISLDLRCEGENNLCCDACGHKMRELKCKLKCERCGYFRSCSDLF